ATAGAAANAAKRPEVERRFFMCRPDPVITVAPGERTFA
ncbi:MAG: hypothetical protein ACI84R_003536, partial [Candidatus Azotimanducaceae bacterium]